MPSAREVRLRITQRQEYRPGDTGPAGGQRQQGAQGDAGRAPTPARTPTKAWQVLTHIAAQPGREKLHPLLTSRERGAACAGGAAHRRPRAGGRV